MEIFCDVMGSKHLRNKCYRNRSCSKKRCDGKKLCHKTYFEYLGIKQKMKDAFGVKHGKNPWHC